MQRKEEAATEVKDFVLLGCDVTSVGNQIPTFRNNLLPLPSIIEMSHKCRKCPNAGHACPQPYFSDISTLEYNDPTLSRNVEIPFPTAAASIPEERNSLSTEVD